MVTFTISIVAVTATEKTRNKDIVQLGCNSFITLTRRFCSLRTDTNKGIVSLVILSCVIAIGIRNAIECSLIQSCRYIFRRTDSSGNIVSTIDGLNQNIMMVSTNVNKGRFTDIGLTRTTIHIATNDNLCMKMEEGRRKKEECR